MPSYLIRTFRGCGLLVVLALGFSACGRDTKIQLKNEAFDKVTPPVVGTKPGSGLDPSGGESPTSRMSYRIFCDAFDGQSGSLTTGSLHAGSGTRRLSLRLTQPDGRIVGAVRDLLPIGAFTFYSGRIIFTAESFGGEQKSGRQVYIGDVDVAGREGTAWPIAKPATIDPKAGALAERLGLSLRMFGVSSGGSLIIVPANGQFSMLRSSDLSVVGTIDLPTDRTFFPALDEESGLFSFMRFENGRFVNGLLKLAVKTGKPSTILETLPVPPPPQSWTALPMEYWGVNGSAQEFVWAERPLAGFESGVAMRVYSVSASTRRLVYEHSSSNERLSSAMTFHKVAGEAGVGLLIVVNTGATSSAGRLQLLKPSGERLAVAAEWSLPRGTTGVLGLISSPNRETWMASLANGSDENVLFRNSDDGLIEVGSGTCRAPSLIQEEL